MKISHVQHRGYQDSLAQTRQKRQRRKKIILISLAVIFFGGVVYLLFFSSIFAIRSLTVEGIEYLNRDQIQAQIEHVLDKKLFGFISLPRNLALTRSSSISNKLLATYPEIRVVVIDKDYPHDLKVEVVERPAIGIWCRTDACQYFDAEGVFWGQAPKSSGSLIISVQDQFSRENSRGLYLGPIQSVAKELPKIGISINHALIPPDAFNEFRVVTVAGYPILFSLDSDLTGQVRAFGLLLEQKKGVIFQPQYVDLRTNGRIYYK